jgi:ADP-heptose:LPS heptosyltransferase
MLTEEGVTKPRYQIWCDHADVTPSSYFPVYQITKEEKRIAKDYSAKWAGKTVIGVGINANDPKRGLLVPEVLAILSKLHEAGLHPVTIDASARLQDYDYIIGKKVSEIIPLLEKMTAVITVDSGLLHMAGVAKTPIVGLFGPTDPNMRMKPYIGVATNGKQLASCSPCWYQYSCLKQDAPEKNRIKCLRNINPDIIIEETLRIINERNITSRK